VLILSLVQIWNYVEKRMELCKSFNEDVLSVALQPRIIINIIITIIIIIITIINIIIIITPILTIVVCVVNHRSGTTWRSVWSCASPSTRTCSPWRSTPRGSTSPSASPTSYAS
jgi:hypothetical protein